jgi:hypothetical protein
MGGGARRNGVVCARGLTQRTRGPCSQRPKVADALAHVLCLPPQPCWAQPFLRQPRPALHRGGLSQPCAPPHLQSSRRALSRRVVHRPLPLRVDVPGIHAWQVRQQRGMGRLMVSNGALVSSTCSFHAWQVLQPGGLPRIDARRAAWCALQRGLAVKAIRRGRRSHLAAARR